MAEHESIRLLRAMGADERHLATWQELINSYHAGRGSRREREVVLSAQMRILQLEIQLERYRVMGFEEDLRFAEETVDRLEAEQARQRARPVLRLVP